jgi:peptide/nickel transport system permease protein
VDRFWRNRLAVVGAVLVAAMLAVALAAPRLAPADPTVANLEEVMQPASRAHPLGTDELGRDLLSRIVWGARTSMLIGAVVLVIALLAGTVVGFAAGWWGGLIDDVLMRAVDVLMTFPSILLAMAIVAALGPGLVNVMIAVGVSAVPRFARIGRAVLLSLRHEVFVEAAWALGASDLRILGRHILPNTLAPLAVQSSLLFATAIQSAAGLGFLGLGAQPPTAEWGAMLADSRVHMRVAPMLVAAPGLAIMIATTAFNLLGDGLRDALDVRLRTP